MNKNILTFVHSLLHTFSKLETLDCKSAVILATDLQPSISPTLSKKLILQSLWLWL